MPHGQSVTCDATLTGHVSSHLNHEVDHLDEITMLLVGCLLGVTAVSAVQYYRQLRRAHREYVRAREAVEDIVLSINRQFKREAEKLESVAYRVQTAIAKGDSAISLVDDAAKKVGSLEAKALVDFESREKMTIRLDEVEKRLRDVVASQEDTKKRTANLEQQAKQFPTIPEIGLEGVIPIRREKAMAQLTETEVSVLEMLASEGPKTAPEIKLKVQLSREHTARLMKKLYEEGYLERDPSKIPFKYSVKKEMEKLLKKPQEQAT